MLEEIKNIIDKNLGKFNINDKVDYSVELPPGQIAADVSTNLALLLSKRLKRNPKEIADEIIGHIKGNRIISDVKFQSGFINIILSDDYIFEKLRTILSKDETFGKRDILQNKKILIEFVSANPTGPLHIGHGRGAAYGDSLARLLEFSGGDVEREYYVNDIGRQIDLLADSVLSYLSDKPLPDGGYKGKYIEEIASELQITNDKLQMTKVKEFTVNKILEWIKSDLEDFRVNFKNWFRESSLYKNNEVDAAAEKLLEKGFAYKKDGAVWFKSTDFSDDKDRVIIREDGRHTYLASDTAYHYNKYKRGFDKYIDIWGADHHGYVERMKGVVRALGCDEKKFKIVLYQLVNIIKEGKKVTMSTRAGEFITLKEVLNEVGVDATRFFLLMRSPESHLDFNLDLAKKQAPENPVYYVQYAHARICSIFREAGKSNDKLQMTNYKLELLKEKQEREIIKKVLFFEDIIEIAVKDYAPHYLTKYLQNIASDFHSYYNKNRVITQDAGLTLARLQMCKAIRSIIKSGLDILGVSAPERM